MPPPPVWGAPFGTGGGVETGDDELGGAYVNEADGLAVAVFVADGVPLAEGDPLAEEDPLALGDPLVDAFALVDALALADAPTDAPSVPDADVPGDGEKIAGCVDAGELVHAATPAEMKTVNVTAPTAVVVLTAAAPLVARTLVRNGVFFI